MLFFIISYAIFALYITYTIVKVGFLPSISYSRYVLPHGKVLFYLFCAGVSLPLMIYWLEVCLPQFQVLAFFSTATLPFVGVASDYFTKPDREVHFVATGIVAALSQLCLALTYTWLWLLVFSGMAALFFLIRPSSNKSHFVYKAELVLFFTTYSLLGFFSHL